MKVNLGGQKYMDQAMLEAKKCYFSPIYSIGRANGENYKTFMMDRFLVSVGTFNEEAKDSTY